MNEKLQLQFDLSEQKTNSILRICLSHCFVCCILVYSWWSNTGSDSLRHRQQNRLEVARIVTASVVFLLCQSVFPHS